MEIVGEQDGRDVASLGCSLRHGAGRGAHSTASSSARKNAENGGISSELLFIQQKESLGLSFRFSVSCLTAFIIPAPAGSVNEPGLQIQRNEILQRLPGEPPHRRDPSPA